MFEDNTNFDAFQFEELSNNFVYNQPLNIFVSSKTENLQFRIKNKVQVMNGKCTLMDYVEFHKYFTQDKKVTFSSSNANYLLRYYHRYSNENQESLWTNIGFKFDKNCQNLISNIGIHKKSQSLQVESNLFTQSYQNGNNYLWKNKLIYKLNKCRLGFLLHYDIKHRNFQTNNIVLQFKPKQNQLIYLRGQVDGFRNYTLNDKSLRNYFDFVILNYIVKPSSTLSLMTQLKYDLNKERIKHIQALIQKSFPNKKIKAKISSQQDIAFQVKFPFQGGSNSNVDFGIQLSDIFKSRKISYGFQINFNI